MVSLDTTQITDHTTTNPINHDLIISSPRISFSSDFLEEMRPNSPLANITTNTHTKKTKNDKKTKHRHVAASDQNSNNFEFLSPAASTTARISSDDGGMISADELFFEGKLLPFWQAHTTERLAKLSLTATSSPATTSAIPPPPEENKKSGHVASVSNTWFVDDDPSPRPPKCTVLWKELLRLKKSQQRRATSTLSPSSSSSSSSSSASSLGDAATSAEEVKRGSNGNGGVNGNSKDGGGNNVKRRSGGLERTRSATIRIRPMINVPICTAVKKSGFGSSLPPLFPLKKGKLFDR